MPKLKYRKKSKRTHIYLPEPQLKVAAQIDNFSKFVQIAVDLAPDIMAWAILKDYDPKKYNTGRKVEDVVDKFNERYPQNELTQKRQGTWRKNSEKKQELW